MNVTLVDNAVQWVRDHPERFFKSGHPTEVELAQSVWLDVTLSGGQLVISHRTQTAWVIASSMNWLQAPPPLSTHDLFTRLIPLKAGGPNSMRGEVVINAFCTEVAAIAAGVTVFAKGVGGAQLELEQTLKKWSGLQAGIAFCL